MLTPLKKPLSEATVMILTSAGVRRKEEPAFASMNDMSFRRVPHSISAGSLCPSHPAPVRLPGEEDTNVVYPYQRLGELADEGFIGGVTKYHLSMLGAIKKLRGLVTDMAPRIAADAKNARADLVLLVPP